MTGRILLVTAHSPLPPVSGGQQRTNLLARALQRLAPVDLVLIADPLSLAPDVAAELRERFGMVACIPQTPRGRFAPWSLVRGAKPALVDRLAHNLGSKRVDYGPDPAVAGAAQERLRTGAYALSVGRYLRPACKAGLTSRPGGMGGAPPAVLDVDDLDSGVYRSRLAAPGQSALARAVIGRHLRQLRDLEPRELARFAHLWLASEEDRPLVDHPSVSVLPNIPFSAGDESPEPLPPAPAACRVAIAVASWDHGPNHLGMSRFLSNVWPRVRERVPDAELRIVGARLSDEHRRAWGAAPGVRAAGFAPSVREAYAEAAVALCPVDEGGGTKIKVLEALAMGRACAATAHSVRGYGRHLRHGESVWVGETDAAMAEGVARLLTDPAMRDAMARHGGEVVRRHYSFEGFCAVVRETVERVTGGATAPVGR